MQRIVDPKQTRLFDPFDPVLTEKTRRRLLDSWAGVFRHIILELMPVDALCGHHSPGIRAASTAVGNLLGVLPMVFLSCMAGLLICSRALGL